MVSIVPASRLSRNELRQLGVEVLYAVNHDGEEVAAVNRSIEVHGEAIDQQSFPVCVRKPLCTSA